MSRLLLSILAVLVVVALIWLLWTWGFCRFYVAPDRMAVITALAIPSLSQTN